MIIRQADFLVWTMKGIFIERIKPDNAFFSNTVDKISTFYIHVNSSRGDMKMVYQTICDRRLKC